MYYGYDPFYDEEPDYLPMTLEQQIRVVYDSDDIMTEHLIDFYNSSRQESYDIIPASTFAVSPKTDKVLLLKIPILKGSSSGQMILFTTYDKHYGYQ